jgi:hypothetical protein
MQPRASRLDPDRTCCGHPDASDVHEYGEGDGQRGIESTRLVYVFIGASSRYMFPGSKGTGYREHSGLARR